MGVWGEAESGQIRGVVSGFDADSGNYDPFSGLWISEKASSLLRIMRFYTRWIKLA